MTSIAERILPDRKMDRFAAVVRKYSLPLLLVISLRAGLSLWMAIVWAVVDAYRPQEQGLVQNSFGAFGWHSSPLGRSLLDVWMRWDAVHYLNIAEVGYQNVSIGDLNFFPLYPYATRALALLLFGQVTLAALILSTFAAGLTFIFLQKFVEEVFEDEKLARWTVVVLAIYPTSIFLFAPYTDALFLCFSILCLLALHRRSWIISGLAGFLAGLTRAQGILLMMPYALALLEAGAVTRINRSTKAWLSFLLIPTGFSAFVFWRRSQGAPDFMATYRGYGDIVFADPLTGFARAFDQAFKTGSLLVYTEILSLLGFGTVLIWMITQRKFRQQSGLLWYSAATLLLFLTKQSVVASVFQSSNRYVLSLFPVFAGIACLVLKLPERVRKLYILASLIGLMAAATLYALFIFVG